MSGNVSKLEELGQCSELVGAVAKAMALVAPKMTKQARQSWIGLPPADFANVLERQIFLPTENADDQPILSRLYTDEEIWVESTNGTRMIADERELFPGYLDSDFINWGTGKPSGIKTKRTQAEVYEMRKDARFRDMIPANQFWQSQDQVLEFVECHRDKLRQGGYATLFPYMDGDMFVALVLVIGGVLGARVYSFGYDRVWYGVFRRRVVLPQLET